ncbi:hypothetical protein [Flavobacterium sp. LB2R40]|uniref:hypothetical protein n=1 Tax=unclassified Flavobacterium TaxID=196869 RepID=UPI003AB040E9
MKAAGTSKNKDTIQKEGEFVTYFKNGNKESVSNYTNSRITGKEYFWYENGHLKFEIKYLKNLDSSKSQSKINQF